MAKQSGEHRSFVHFWQLTGLTILSLMIFLFSGFSFFGNKDEDKKKPSPTPQAQVAKPSKSSRSPKGKAPKHLLTDEQNTIKIFRQVGPSVVGVTNMALNRSWTYGMVEIPQGAGSGFVWDDQGHIVTNFHVVQGGDKFLISFFQDKKQYEAKLVGKAPSKDIAVLKLTERPKTMSSIPIGQSKGLLVGQKAIAIGNPFGLEHTITTGIISATGREIQGIGGNKIQDIIQTDASINRGNSGGPLLDSLGRLIGMNTAIASPSGSSAGVGFAVPVDTIKEVVEQIIRYGKVIRPALGIMILPQSHQAYWNIPKGLVIAQVVEGGAAAKAGLQGIRRDKNGRYHIGDIVLKIDGKEITDFYGIYQILDKYKVGDEVEVTYKREGKELKTKVKLMEYNGDR